MRRGAKPGKAKGDTRRPVARTSPKNDAGKRRDLERRLAEPRGMRPLVAHCHLGLGKLDRRTGRREQAREHLTTATMMYREMGMTFWLEKAEREMKECR